MCAHARAYHRPEDTTSEGPGGSANRRGSGATPCNPIELKHLRPLRSSGARPPLICLFPGPPGASDLADALPDDQPVYEIFWPNMDNETSFPSVEQLAELFIQDLRKLQAHGPYQFCGYSTFGLVAYEMGRLLQSQGEEVPFLALFDIWHPKFLQMQTRGALARYRIMRVTDRLGKYRAVSATRQDRRCRRASARVHRQESKVDRLAGKPIYLPNCRPSGAARLQVIESIAANQTYVPPPYPRRFILVRPHDFLERAVSDQTTGWHVCATAGVDIHFVRRGSRYDQGQAIRA